MTKTAPVVLFAYNRPDHLQRTLRALAANALAQHSLLIVYSDGAAPESSADADKVHQVRAILDQVCGFRDVRVISRATRNGLARSVITGLDQVAREFDRFIVVEDDLITAPCFLEFLNDALEQFAERDDVLSVSSYVPQLLSDEVTRHCREETFLSPRPMSWGWATWRNRWQEARWDRDYTLLLQDQDFVRRLELGGRDLALMLRRQVAGMVDSWAIRWVVEHALADAYSLSPVRSLVENIGLDRTGTHSSPDPRLDATAPGATVAPDLLATLRPEPKLLKDVQDYFGKPWRSELVFHIQKWRRKLAS